MGEKDKDATQKYGWSPYEFSTHSTNTENNQNAGKQTRSGLCKNMIQCILGQALNGISLKKTFVKLYKYILLL